MRRILVRTLTVGLCAIAVGLLLIEATSPIVRAQAETVDILVPELFEGAGQSCAVRASLPTDPGDFIVFTGRSTSTADSGNCAYVPGSYPVQGVLAVDANGGRATRFCYVITVSQTTPVR